MMEPAFGRLERALRAAGIPFHGIGPLVRGRPVGPGNVRLDFIETATDAQRNQAAQIVAAFDWSVQAQATALRQQQRADAKALYDAADRFGKLDRARDLALLKAINLLYQWLTRFKGEVAASGTFADFKRRVASMPDLPDRTLMHVKEAIQNALDSGQVD